MSDYQQQGMFDDIPEEANVPASPRTGIDVVRLRFESAETMSWQELFEGFDSIHAITYSSGIGFVSKLLNMFETAEVIFGCESVLQFNMQEIIALQAGVCSFCSSDRGFAHREFFIPQSGFLQTPPHDGRPCLRLTVPTAKSVVDSHHQVIMRAEHTHTNTGGLFRSPPVFFYSLRTNASMRSSAWVMCLTE